MPPPLCLYVFTIDIITVLGMRYLTLWCLIITLLASIMMLGLDGRTQTCDPGLRRSLRYSTVLHRDNLMRVFFQISPTRLPWFTHNPRAFPNPLTPAVEQVSSSEHLYPIVVSRGSHVGSGSSHRNLARFGNGGCYLPITFATALGNTPFPTS